MPKVAFIVDEMFEDSEFQVPFDRIAEAGHETVIVGLEKGKAVRGKRDKVAVRTDVSIEEVSADDFDALVIPGGYSPDKIRSSEEMVSFTRKIHGANKPVAAICHAGWMLAEADLISGKTVTSWPSIKTDLINAGAKWVDEEVVEDGNLITSRKPDDLDAFVSAILKQLDKS